MLITTMQAPVSKPCATTIANSLAALAPTVEQGQLYVHDPESKTK